METETRMTTSISSEVLKIHGRTNRQFELQRRGSVDKYAIIHIYHKKNSEIILNNICYVFLCMTDRLTDKGIIHLLLIDTGNLHKKNSAVYLQ